GDVEDAAGGSEEDVVCGGVDGAGVEQKAVGVGGAYQPPDQRHREKDVRIHNHDVVVKLLTRTPQRENRAFLVTVVANIADPHSGAGRSDLLLDHLPAVPDHHHGPRDPGRAEGGQSPLQQGFPPNLDQAFGPPVGDFFEAFADAGGKNDGFHASVHLGPRQQELTGSFPVPIPYQPFAPSSPQRRYSAGTTNGYKGVEINSPRRITTAMGCSISWPARSPPRARGKRPKAATRAVIRIGARRSSEPRMTSSRPNGRPVSRRK